jgi:hypothetical protein
MLKSFSILVTALILLAATDSVLLAQIFKPAVNYPVGLRPYVVVSADFDGDGDFDLATVPSVAFDSDGKGWVSVLMNNGDGTFAPPDRYDVGDALSLVAADLDNDGDIDLAASDYFTHAIYILLNDGAGAFAVADTFAAGGLNPQILCAADFDGNGGIDLAVPNSGSNNLSVIFNNGHAAFSDPVLYAMGTYPITAISADLDSDGDSDLVVTNNGSASVSVLLNNGSGLFAPRVDYAVRTDPYSPSLADYDEDGVLDLAVPNASPATPFVSVLKGNGDGTFQPKVDWPGCRPHTVASADYNLDGHIDMAVANNECNSVSVFLGNGDGTFAPQVSFPAGIGTQYIVARDFDRDGTIDLAACNFDNDGQPGDNVSVLLHFTTGVQELVRPLLSDFVLKQNYPNPFNPTTAVSYQLPVVSDVKLVVYDMLGREVAVLVNEQKNPGRYEVQFDASRLASGVYYYRLISRSYVETRKMILMR